MTLANLLDVNGNFVIDDVNVTAITANSLSVANTVQASTLQLNGSGGSVQLTADPSNNVQLGTGRFVLDTTTMRPGGFSWRPTLASGSVSLGANGSAALATLPVSKTGLLYRLTDTLTFSSTFAGSSTLTFYLDQVSGSAQDVFALNNASLVNPVNGAQSVPLDLFAYSATPISALFLNCTATGQAGTLTTLAWSSAPAILTANCSGAI